MILPQMSCFADGYNDSIGEDIHKSYFLFKDYTTTARENTL